MKVMKRILIKQMRNEWRDNLWLVLALTIVLIAIWILSLVLWREIQGVVEPLGFDSEDVFTLKVESLPPESPEYVDYGDERDALEREDRLALMRQIRQSPNVEAAAWSNNFIPYDLSFWGNSIFITGGNDTIGYSGNFRRGSPDIARVLKLKSHSGKTPQQLADILSKGEVLVGTSYGDVNSRTPEEMLGKTVNESGDSVNRYRVADIIDNVRRSDYEIPWGGVIVIPIDDENPGGVSGIIFRVKPGKGEAFAEELDNSPAMQQHRNLYLSSLTKLTDMRDAVLGEADSTVRASVGVMLVFLVVILLGLLGTFWFRVQQRVSEIAIRKVCGASRGDVFRRVLSEGLTLLLTALVLASAVAVPLVNSGKIEALAWPSLTPLFVAGAVATAIVAAGITLSIAYPAWRAMRIEPAVAVKEE